MYPIVAYRVVRRVGAFCAFVPRPAPSDGDTRVCQIGNVAVLNDQALGVARSNANAAGELHRRTLNHTVLDHVARILVRRERVLILPNLNTISTNVCKIAPVDDTVGRACQIEADTAKPREGTVDKADARAVGQSHGALRELVAPVGVIRTVENRRLADNAASALLLNITIWTRRAQKGTVFEGKALKLHVLCAAYNEQSVKHRHHCFQSLGALALTKRVYERAVGLQRPIAGEHRRGRTDILNVASGRVSRAEAGQ